MGKGLLSLSLFPPSYHYRHYYIPEIVLLFPPFEFCSSRSIGVKIQGATSTQFNKYLLMSAVSSEVPGAAAVKMG